MNFYAEMASFVESPVPGLITRYGFTEIQILNSFLTGQRYSLEQRFLASTGAGIWPPTDKELLSFVAEYLGALQHSRYIGSWGPEVSSIFEEVSLQIGVRDKLIPAAVLDPIACPPPNDVENWLHAISDKSLLVIHPMTSSIESQASKLHLVHASMNLRPSSVRTFRPPVTNGLNFGRSGFTRSLEDSKLELESVMSSGIPDLVLVAAGAYGAVLANHAFRLGAKAIHVGGSLQLIFGILGSRWRETQSVQEQLTGDWLGSPLEKRPRGSWLIEKATYW